MSKPNYMSWPEREKEIRKMIKEILPNDLDVLQMNDGQFKIEGTFKKGKLSKVRCGQKDYFSQAYLQRIESKFTRIIALSNKLRRNFTGRIELRVEMVDGSIYQLYHTEGSYIIHKNSNYKSKI